MPGQRIAIVSDMHGNLGAFEAVLADAREQVGAVGAYIEALRDFWLSESDLQAAFNGPPTGRRHPQ